MIDLTGQVAVVTGAASGSAPPSPAASPLAAPTSSSPTSIPPGRTSPTRSTACSSTPMSPALDDNHAAMAVAVDRFGRLDVAVLNAGIGETGAYVDNFDLERYRNIVAVNLDGVVYGTKAALDVFKTQGSGSILVMSSLSGVSASPFNPLYAASKHAVVGLVRSVAPTVAERGVTLNALCPTFIDTPILGDAVPYLRSVGMAVLVAGARGRCGRVGAHQRQHRAGLAGRPRTPDPFPFAFPQPPELMSDPAHQATPALQTTEVQ